MLKAWGARTNKRSNYGDTKQGKGEFGEYEFLSQNLL